MKVRSKRNLKNNDKHKKTIRTVNENKINII